MAASFVILRCGKRTENEGGVLELLGNDFTLGRADTCAVKTESDVVSRHHASLQLVDQGWVIADLNSSNGTFVNARRVETAELRLNDKVMLGEGGPVYEVIALESGGAEGDLESTRFLRVAKRKKIDEAHPAEPTAPSPKPKPAPPPPPPKPAPAPPPEPEPLFLDEVESAPLSIEPVSEPTPPPPPVEAPKPKRVKPKETAKPPPPKPEPVRAPPESPRKRRGFPVGAVAGIVFGVLVGQMWLGKEFPYLDFGAPGLWMWRGMIELEWSIAATKAEWAVTVSLAFYYMLVGFALQRPVKRFPFLVFLGVCHGAAIYFIRNP